MKVGDSFIDPADDEWAIKEGRHYRLMAIAPLVGQHCFMAVDKTGDLYLTLMDPQRLEPVPCYYRWVSLSKSTGPYTRNQVYRLLCEEPDINGLYAAVSLENEYFVLRELKRISHTDIDFNS